MKTAKCMCAALMVGASCVGTGILFSASKPPAQVLAFAAEPRTRVTAGNKMTAKKPLLKNLTIVPGQSVGDVRIGDSPHRVRQLLGPWSGFFLSGALGSQTETYPQEIMIRYRDSKVVEIHVSSKRFLTRQGISVGKNRREVQRAFRGGVWRHNWYTVSKKRTGGRKINEYIYDMVQPGIAFRFGEDYRNPSAACREIQVNRPAYGMNGGKLIRGGPR